MMIAFGIACLAVYALNTWAAYDAKPRYADASGVAMLLCVSYGLTNLLVAFYGLPEAVSAFPVMDLVFTYMVWRAWRRNRRVWKLGVMSLLVAQLAMHAAFIFLWKTSDINGGNLYTYILLLNVAFTGQLIFVGSAGLHHVLARAVRHLSGDRVWSSYEGSR